MHTTTIKQTLRSKTMKKTIALLTLPALLLTSSLSFASSDSSNGHSWGGGKYSEEGGHKNSAKYAAKKLKKMSKKLDLSKDQEAQLKTLFEARQVMRESGMQARKTLHESIRNLDPKAADYTTKLAAVKQQAGAQAQSKIDSMMSMRASLQEILSADQYQKMQEMMDKRSKKNKHRS
jgi:Spy/CpxP family protein refolding chaperone